MAGYGVPVASVPQPPSGKTGLMLPPSNLLNGPALADNPMFYKEAVDDMFWFINSTEGMQNQGFQTDRARRLVDIYPSLPQMEKYQTIPRLRIITSTEAPGKMGEQGVAMYVKLNQDFYWAKLIPVASDVYDLFNRLQDDREPRERIAKNTTLSFREVMINLSLFKNNAKSNAPMYNWFFTSVPPTDGEFMNRFSPAWQAFVFNSFYAKALNNKLKAKFSNDKEALKTMVGKEHLSHDKIQSLYILYVWKKESTDSLQVKLSKTIDAIEKYNVSRIEAFTDLKKREKYEEAKNWLTKYFEKFFNIKWFKVATLINSGPKHAIVLIAKSVGDFNLGDAYLRHGYAFPMDRFLGYQDAPIDKSGNRGKIEKRYGIVFKHRPFSALMMHVLAFCNEMQQLQIVHGDFHYENLIAVPVREEGQDPTTMTFSRANNLGKKEMRLPTKTWIWEGSYREGRQLLISENNRQELKDNNQMYYNSLPLYVSLAPFKKDGRLPFPYTVGWSQVGERQAPGQYLEFSLIDFGFAYRKPEYLANDFNTDQARHDERKFVLDWLWHRPILEQMEIYPVMYHPWYDTFRFGLYMIRSVLNSVKMANQVLGNRTNKGGQMVELILRMMSTPRWLDGSQPNYLKGRILGSPFYRESVIESDPREQIFVNPGDLPVTTVRGYYTELLPFNQSDEFMVRRFSIEFITMALRLTEPSPGWKKYARIMVDKNPSQQDLFMRCDSGIHLMRHFLLTLVLIYKTFKVVPSATGGHQTAYRNDIQERRVDVSLENFLPAKLFATSEYLTNVENGASEANQNFTRALSLVLTNVGVDKKYMSAESIMADKRLWSVLI